jgi:chromosome segregation and condensation protein ScpB
LLHAGPGGLGNAILDNCRGERAVVDAIAELQNRGLIQERKADADSSAPFKLTAAGAEAAKQH